MDNDQWSQELSDFYHDLSIHGGARENIAQIRTAALETRRWKQVAGTLAVSCAVVIALSTFFAASRIAEPVIVNNTNERPRNVRFPATNAYDLVAVRVHRDWCGKCKKMGNVFTELQHDLSGRKILFLTFDLTDSETTRQSLVVSDSLAISKALQGIQSGNIVLLDRNGQRLETLDGTSGRAYLATQIASRL